MITIGKSGNYNIGLDLATLQETRLLIQANSGAGKSWTLRRLIEQLFGNIHIIVIDLEGEVPSLRPKYDIVIAGKDYEVPVTVKTASMLAEKLMKHEVSAVIDLYDLKKFDRTQYVKHFIETLMSLKKGYYHPVLIVLDEAHIFCPEKGQADSFAAVEDLLTRGRKRGYCTVMATQRLAMLSKNVTAQLINIAIGRTTQDIDQARASDQLGFNKKDRRFELGGLSPGNFKVLGPAWRIKKGDRLYSLESVTDLEVGRVISKHPKVGGKVDFKAPKPNKSIMAVLTKIGDLPKEAAEKAKTLQDLKSENRSLIIQLAKRPKPCNHEGQIQELGQEIQYISSEKDNIYKIAEENQGILREIINMLKSVTLDDLKNYSCRTSPVKLSKAAMNAIVNTPKSITKNRLVTGHIDFEKDRIAKDAKINFPVDDVKLTKGPIRILNTLANRCQVKTTKAQLATLSNFKKGSGTFSTYLSTLKTATFILVESGNYSITENGMTVIDYTPDNPQGIEEIQASWKAKLKGGCKRMFETLIEAGESGIDKHELAAAVGLTFGTGTWGTYLSALRSNDLITVSGDRITINQDLIGG